MTKKTPGPLAPPDTSLPSLKMTALSYSWTTLTAKKRLKGSVVISSITEKTLRRWANKSGPSSHAAFINESQKNRNFLIRTLRQSIAANLLGMMAKFSHNHVNCIISLHEKSFNFVKH